MSAPDRKLGESRAADPGTGQKTGSLSSCGVLDSFNHNSTDNFSSVLILKSLFPRKKKDVLNGPITIGDGAER